ncbi:hypothetical protein IWW36_003773 [Coemansia brasiliensis]|uniref:BZIP domain-containing protein n=1 Tax=Coemansia brasiliensis TaxID=2650707 RepID=A0A9W8LWW7_9FUNG|nr:hypothetical protein IWW36_003773 [Coemansia brasiliensis]
MEEYLSMINAATPQSQLFSKGRENECILSSFADNYEAWAYPDTQQQVFFDEWISAAPPPTALTSPSLATQSALLDSSALSPALSSPSLISSSQSSPTLNLASSLQSTQSASAAPVQPPLSVADYAAALFPDLAASLSGALALPMESPAGFAKSASVMAPQPFAQANASPAALSSWATDLASMLEAQTPVSPAESQSETASPEPMQSLVHVTSGETDEQRKRRDCEFLESLPPQLRLKRRRTSNTKQKEKILAELLQPAAPAATVASAPMKKTTAVRKPKSAAESSEEADGEVLDAAALKRKKNTDAARRSRMRKILRIETLEGRVSELESENAQLAQRIAQLEAEKAAMAQRM